MYTNDHSELAITVNGQESKPFYGSSRIIRPDIVLRRGNETYIIDTKWKQSSYASSIEDLRQMYTYGRFWNAKDLMLLYPGNSGSSNLKSYHNTEFVQNDEKGMQHRCMKGVVSVLDQDGKELDDGIGENVLRIFEIIE